MKDYFHVCVGRLHIDIVIAYSEDDAINIIYPKWSSFGDRDEFRAFRCKKT